MKILEGMAAAGLCRPAANPQRMCNIACQVKAAMAAAGLCRPAANPQRMCNIACQVKAAMAAAGPHPRPGGHPHTCVAGSSKCGICASGPRSCASVTPEFLHAMSRVRVWWCRREACGAAHRAGRVCKGPVPCARSASWDMGGMHSCLHQGTLTLKVCQDEAWLACTAAKQCGHRSVL